MWSTLVTATITAATCLTPAGWHQRSLRRRLAAATHAAHHDPLTGLPNRRALDQHLAAAISRRDLAVILVDLDDYKTINDRCGHPTGDAVLRQVADRLQDLTATGEVVARLGGDEFVIVTTPANVSLLAEAVRTGVAARAYHTPNGPRRLRASVGTACWQPGDAQADVLRRADTAMYADKGGRDDSRRIHRHQGSGLSAVADSDRRLTPDDRDPGMRRRRAVRS